MKDKQLFLQCVFSINTYQKVRLLSVAFLMRIQRCQFYFPSKNRFNPQNIGQKGKLSQFYSPEN